MPYLDRLIARSRCVVQVPLRVVLRYSSSEAAPGTADAQTSDHDTSFPDHISELRRRKKRVEEKRRQHVRWTQGMLHLHILILLHFGMSGLYLYRPHGG